MILFFVFSKINETFRHFFEVINKNHKLVSGYYALNFLYSLNQLVKIDQDRQLNDDYVRVVMPFLKICLDGTTPIR